MKHSALLSVNLAVFFFGLAGLFAKWVELPALWITFGRVLFSSAALFLFAKLTRQPLALRSRRDGRLFLLSGCVLAFHWWSFLASIQLSTVAIGTITFSSFPLFLTFLEPLVFRRRLSLRNIAAALLILLGVLVTVPEFSVENRMARGVLLGMGCALSYAVLTLLNKAFSGRYSATVISFFEQSVAALVLLPLVIRTGLLPSPRDVGLLLLLGVFTTALAHSLFISSLRHIPAQLAGICSSMETVYGILLAFLLLGEAPSLRECLGAVIILGVVIWSQLAQPEEA